MSYLSALMQALIEIVLLLSTSVCTVVSSNCPTSGRSPLLRPAVLLEQLRIGVLGRPATSSGQALNSETSWPRTFSFPAVSACHMVMVTGFSLLASAPTGQSDAGFDAPAPADVLAPATVAGTDARTSALATAGTRHRLITSVSMPVGRYVSVPARP